MHIAMGKWPFGWNIFSKGVTKITSETVDGLHGPQKFGVENTKEKTTNWQRLYNVVPPFTIAKLVNITPRTVVYDTYNIL